MWRVLGCVENVFPSRAYRDTLVPRIKGFGNLTGRLTPDLTASLTGYLTADLTESGVREVERAGKRAQDASERPWRRWDSASARTFDTTEWCTPARSASTFFRASTSERVRILATTDTG